MPRAATVKVDVSGRAIISALNTPGGAVFRWRDRRGREILNECEAKSPINNVLNAQHRGGVVGTYKFGWRGDRVGSGGHNVQARVYNVAPHAVYVEEGRRASSLIQTFSWTAFDGRIRTIGGHLGGGTSARPGRHILRDTVNEVGTRTGDWTPLV